MLKLILLVIFLTTITVKSQSPNDQEDDYNPAGNIAAGTFQANLAVVISILACMFFLTFFILVYAKFCRRSSPNDVLNHGPLIRSTSRYSGIDKTVIESLPFFRFSSLRGSRKGLECAVCLSKFQDVEILRLLPKCKHAFHIACVDEWLEKHSSCPLCRHKVSIDDLTMLTYSNSLRYLGSHSDSRQDSNIDLFVQREGETDHGSSRFNPVDSLKGKKEEELPIQESCEICDENLHKFNHKIIFNEFMLWNRWSNVNYSDLLSLNSEMINVTSSYRFSSNDHQLASKQEIEDVEVANNIKENKVNKTDELGQLSRYRNYAASGSNITNTNEKRSMSEIVVHPRYREFSVRNDAGDRKNDVKQERMRSLWLPIVRRTVELFANRESSSSRSSVSQNARPSFGV